jgi:hypothetical protein
MLKVGGCGRGGMRRFEIGEMKLGKRRLELRLGKYY